MPPCWAKSRRKAAPTVCRQSLGACPEDSHCTTRLDVAWGCGALAVFRSQSAADTPRPHVRSISPGHSRAGAVHGCRVVDAVAEDELQEELYELLVGQQRAEQVDGVVLVAVAHLSQA